MSALPFLFCKITIAWNIFFTIWNTLCELTGWIDQLSSMDTCIDYLRQKAMELVTKVKVNTIPQEYSHLINNCIHLIHIHLHDRLKIETIAQTLHVSRDYLSYAFKKETGIPLHKYILHQKLEESRKMLSSGMSIKEVSYTLSFSDESHFIQSYKKNYGVTPAVYISSLTK